MKCMTKTRNFTAENDAGVLNDSMLVYIISCTSWWRIFHGIASTRQELRHDDPQDMMWR